MPTEMGIQFIDNPLYLCTPDGKFVPLTTGITEVTLSDDDTKYDVSAIDLSIPNEMSFTIRLKRSPKTLLRALGLPTKRRSMRAIGRPIRRIMRLKEKHRRYILKNGIDNYIISSSKRIFGGTSR